MSILDLLEKYESKDSIDYLIKELGNKEYLNDLFTSTMGIKYFIENRKIEYRFYEIIHNIYINIENNSNIDDTLMNCLIIMESYYKGLTKPIVLAKQRKDSTIKLSNRDVIIKQNDKISKMYTIDTLPKDYKYYYYACNINRDIKDFSLDKQYNLESGFNYKEGLNSVTVITPTQTISRFNDDSVNGLKGSGYHDANFDQIVETVYGEKIINSMTGQDIRIRHITEINDFNRLDFKIVIDMPYVINSTQYEALYNLNNEIKKIAKKLDNDFIIHVVLTDYENRDFVKFIENKNNLDEILNIVAVDDVKENKYQERCFIGYSNMENHYNDKTIVR